MSSNNNMNRGNGSDADTVSGASMLDNVTGTFKDAFGFVSPKQKLDDYGSSATGGLRYKLNSGTGSEGVNCKCRACGAPLRGARGTSVTCEYCGTRQKL